MNKILKRVTALIVALLAFGLSTAQPAGAKLPPPTPEPVTNYLYNLSYHFSVEGVTLTWTLRYLYFYHVQITRAPAFDASFYPTGAATVNPPPLPQTQPATVGTANMSFTDMDVSRGAAYTYNVCVNPISLCAQIMTAPAPHPSYNVLAPHQLPLLAMHAPVIGSVIRNNASTVTVTWTHAADVTDHFNIMVNTAASMPDPTATGWSTAGTAASTASKQTVSVTSAPVGQRNYFMVCAADVTGKRVVCSTPVAEMRIPPPF